LIYRIMSGECASNEVLEDKVAIVTGASAGIGKVTAMDLAKRKAKVILACRNVAKAQKVADEIIKTTGNQNVIVKEVDTSDLSSVRKFAKGILETEPKLHILINNAGIGGLVEKCLTPDGLEKVMATNHYGHFLLTNILGGLLKESAPSRVVCVSSLMHKFARYFDPNDMNFSQIPFKGHRAYAYSKLCNILMAAEIDKRLKDQGVTAYSVHPGVVSTEIWGKHPSVFANALGKLVNIFGKNEVEGAQTTIHCAVDKEVTEFSGKYFADCKVEEPDARGKNAELAAKVWEASALDVRLTEEEANI